MKKVWSLLVAMTMLVTLSAPAAAAAVQTASANTIRLNEVEGTATVKNASDQAMDQRDGMRLYNGYEIATEEASYAYMNLDQTKAVKLDASSIGEINSQGKKLELKVTAGKMFFNVSKPVAADSSLNIRTSTMVAGVRGTAGWTWVINRYVTRIALMEGTLNIISEDPYTGEDRSVTIHGGQIATLITPERAAEYEQELKLANIIIEENIVHELTELGQVVEELRESDVPGFVATEVAKDNDLQDRIAENTDLDVAQIIADAPARLAQDEQQAQEQKEQIDEALDDVVAQQGGLPTEEIIVEVPGDTVYVEVPGDTVYVEIPGDTVYVDAPAPMNDPTAEEINTAFENEDVVAVADVTDALVLSDLEMDEGDTLYINSGSVTVDEPTDLDGTVYIMPDADMTVEDTLNITTDNSLHIFGELINYDGEIRVGVDAETPGKLQIHPEGVFYNHGTIDLTYGTLINDGLFENHSPGFSYFGEGMFYSAGEFVDSVNEAVVYNADDESKTVVSVCTLDDLYYEDDTVIILLKKPFYALPNTFDAENVTLDLCGYTVWIEPVESDSEEAPVSTMGVLSVVDGELTVLSTEQPRGSLRSGSGYLGTLLGGIDVAEDAVVNLNGINVESEWVIHNYDEEDPNYTYYEAYGIVNKGELNLCESTVCVTDEYADDTIFGTVYGVLNVNGQVTMFGGSIQAETAYEQSDGVGVLNESEFTMNGGTIVAAGDMASGVENYNQSQFTLTDGLIMVEGTGAIGVVNYDASEFTMSGGEILVTGEWVVGVDNDEDSAFAMSGGEVCVKSTMDLHSEEYDSITIWDVLMSVCGVHNAEGCQVTIYDGAIKVEGVYHGVGLYNEAYADLMIYDGSVSAVASGTEEELFVFGLYDGRADETECYESEVRIDGCDISVDYDYDCINHGFALYTSGDSLERLYGAVLKSPHMEDVLCIVDGYDAYSFGNGTLDILDGFDAQNPVKIKRKGEDPFYMLSMMCIRYPNYT